MSRFELFMLLFIMGLHNVLFLLKSMFDLTFVCVVRHVSLMVWYFYDMLMFRNIKVVGIMVSVDWFVVLNRWFAVVRFKMVCFRYRVMMINFMLIMNWCRDFMIFLMFDSRCLMMIDVWLYMSEFMMDNMRLNMRLNIRMVLLMLTAVMLWDRSENQWFIDRKRHMMDFVLQDRRFRPMNSSMWLNLPLFHLCVLLHMWCDRMCCMGWIMLFMFINFVDMRVFVFMRNFDFEMEFFMLMGWSLRFWMECWRKSYRVMVI